MLFQKYLNSISELNPEKIYVENVRSFLHIPSTLAKFICEMAVVDNVFQSKIGIVCPNTDCRRIIKSYNKLTDIPNEIECEICEHTEHEHFIFNTEKLEKIKYYKLNK